MPPITPPRKRPKQKHEMSDAAKLIWTGLGIAAIVAALMMIGALIFMVFTWNLGVIGLAASLGLTVSKIGFWTAFGAMFVIATLGGILHGNPVHKKE